MKKYLLYLLLAFAAISFTACEDDAEPMGTTVSTDQTSISFNGQGASSQSLSVLANGDWIAVTPEWITVTPNYGTGNMQVTVTVADNLDTDGTLAAERKGEITFTLNGNPSLVEVYQAGDPNKKPAEIKKVTVAQVLAAPVDPTAYYEVTGTIANIKKRDYGNFDLVDATGSIYVYGLLEYEGAPQKGAFDNLNLQEGDKLTLRGPRAEYNGSPQIQAAYYVSHEASLISATPAEMSVAKDASEFEVKLAYKGETFEVAIEDAAKSWLSMVAINPDPNPESDTTIIKFAVQPNEGGAREGSVSFTSANDKASSTVKTIVKQEGSIVDITVADFIAKDNGTALYRLSGKVARWYGKEDSAKKYGNFYIEDATGEVCVYGLASTPGGESGKFADLGISLGDIVTVVGVRDAYNNTPQMGDAYYVEHTSHKDATVAEVLAASKGDTYYKVTGTIANIKSAEYGNFDLVDGTNSIYVYGLTKAPVAKNDKSFASLGLKEGDKVTLVGKRDEYKGDAQIGGAYYLSHETGDAGEGDGNEGEGGEGETPAVTGDPKAIIISEYVEGSSNNKYLEIANISDKEVDLAAYKLLLYTNGSTEFQNELALTGKLAAGAVKVYKNDKATLLAESIPAEATNVTYFNGDDVIVLTCNGTAVDAFGTVGHPKDDKYAENKTFRRKTTVVAPTMTFNIEEWEEFAIDDVSGLGKR